jgi:hypothetical protein
MDGIESRDMKEAFIVLCAGKKSCGTTCVCVCVHPVRACVCVVCEREEVRRRTEERVLLFCVCLSFFFATFLKR